MTAAGTVTLLFTDLVGSTRLLEELGDERAEALRRAHFRLMRDAVDARGGEEVKTLGDGIMAAFPSTVDAVGCAVAMQRAVDRQNTREPNGRLSVRVGLNAGEPIRSEGDYFGTPVVVAHRLCETAEGGQIVASGLVEGLVGVRGGHRFRELGALALKGLTAPVPAFEVVWQPEGEERVPLPAVFSGERSPFVGREAELELLRERWELARSGRRQLVMIEGEPGIGKTRLATELCLDAYEQGATVLYGHTYEETPVPYQPLAEALRQYVLACPVEQLVARLPVEAAGQVVRLAPELAERFPVPPPRSLADDEEERYRFFEAVAGAFASAAETAPLIVVVDDLHWADKPTLLLLKHIVRSLEHCPLLVLGAYRGSEVERRHQLSETLADLRRDRLLSPVALHGLPREQVSRLIAGFSGAAPPTEFVTAVYEETEGNPFFVEEIVRHLSESGAIPGSDGADATDPRLLGIPDEVRDAIGRRLVKLSDAAVGVLTAAAVIGRRFEADVLERIVDLPTDGVLEVLEEALMARLIREDGGGFGVYSFSHALIRDALYDELSATRRARLHLRIGEALEALYGDDTDPPLGELSRHFFAGGRPPDRGKAVAYAERAAGRAAVQLAWEEAARQYERALEALGGAGDLERRFDLTLALGEVQWNGGEFRQARGCFQQAAEIAQRLGSPERMARAALGFGGPFASFASGVVDEELIQLLENALASLEEEDSTLRAHVMSRLGEALTFSRERRRGIALSREAVESARRLGDPETLAHAMIHAHWATWNPDNLGQRIVEVSEVIRLAEQAGEATVALQARIWRLSHHLERGDEQGARAEFDSCLAIAENLRQPYGAWQVATLRAMRSLTRGRFDEAEELAAKALTVGQEAQNENAVALYGVQLLVLRRQQGRFAELEPAVGEFVRRYAAIPGWKLVAALLALELGHVDEAREAWERASKSKFAVFPRDVFWLPTMSLCVEVCAALGDRERAAELYELLLPYAERCIVLAPVAGLAGAMARFLGMAATVHGRFDDAEAHFAQALDLEQRIGSPPLAAQTRLELARMLLARDRPQDAERAARELALAVGTARELGMKALLADAVPLEALAAS